MNSPSPPPSPATPTHDAAGTVAASFAETLDTLRDIAAYFHKEANYERENMGAGGSRIALGMWERYYRTLENVIQDLPELRAASRDLASLQSRLAEVERDRDTWVTKAAENMKLYLDLLMQVQNVVPGETRHESARRIIQQHENQSHGPCSDKAALSAASVDGDKGEGK